MRDIIRKKGHQVSLYSGTELEPDISMEPFDAVIIGGSVHMGNYPASLKTFIKQHKDWLTKVPSAFFTVCMGINSELVESRIEASHYGDRYLESVDWQPQLVATFAGAVKYTQYDAVTRLIMKWISKKEGGSTDTTHDHEYTDWNAVDRFTDQFLQQVMETETV
jgi:menaquinone-dependent protoporphyrinogen oxidase